MAVSCWYVVIESLGKYWVDCEGRSLGPYDEIADATDGAIHLAEMLGEEHKLRSVMVPDGCGHFDIAWQRDPIDADRHGLRIELNPRSIAVTSAVASVDLGSRNELRARSR